MEKWPPDDAEGFLRLASGEKEELSCLRVYDMLKLSCCFIQREIGAR
jgi:hypothetical protein